MKRLRPSFKRPAGGAGAPPAVLLTASVCVPAPRGLQPSVRPAAGVCGRAGRVFVSVQSAGESRNHRAEES